MASLARMNDLTGDRPQEPDRHGLLWCIPRATEEVLAVADVARTLCWTSTCVLEFAMPTEDTLGSRESSSGKVALGGWQAQTRGE